MKFLLLLLALASSSVFAQTETVTVTGKKLPKISANPGTMVGDGPSGGAAGVGGTSGGGGSGKFGGDPSNAQLVAMAMDQFGKTINQLAELQAWGELEVSVTTPEKTVFMLKLKVGFGKTEVVRKIKAPASPK